MKLICIILSCMVLVLTLKPCCTDNDCTGIATLTKVADAHSSSQKKECRGCSPFFACGTCAGFIVAKVIIHKPSPPAGYVLKHCTVYTKPYLEDVARAIWQPPQLG